MKLEPILIIPDTHVPYHDEKAFELMLKVGRYLNPKHIVIQGDFADFYAVSSHDKDPNRKNNLEYEVDEVNKALNKIDALGAKEKIYVSGNHENRLERYLMQKAPELFNVFRIQDLFNLKDRGWIYVPYKQDYQLGKLYITHDVGASGSNAVNKALSTYQGNITTGHTHRIHYQVEGCAKGKAHVGASFGWLGDAKQADYMHRVKAARDWALGFGVGYLDTTTNIVYITPIPIINYTCVVEGKQFSV